MGERGKYALFLLFLLPEVKKDKKQGAVKK